MLFDLYAYAPDGHYIVASLGILQTKSNTMKSLFSEIPKNEIYEASNWADRVKRPDDRYPWSYSLHFVNFNEADNAHTMCHLKMEYDVDSSKILNQCSSDCRDTNQYDIYYESFVPSSFCPSYTIKPCRSISYKLGDCPEEFCIVTALNNFTSQAKSCWNHNTLKNACSMPLKESLKFILHFMGDSHQILHICGIKCGGNLISARFEGISTNIHRVWDEYLIDYRIKKFAKQQGYYNLHHDDIIERYISHLDEIIKNLPEKQKNNILSCSSCSSQIQKFSNFPCFLDWTSRFHCDFAETVWLFSRYSYENGDDLVPRYADSMIPLIDRFFILAGIRLSCVLDHIFNVDE